MRIVKGYQKDFPDFVVVLLDYLERLFPYNWERIALYVMPSISYSLNELSELAWHFNSADEFLKDYGDTLNSLLETFVNKLLGLGLKIDVENVISDVKEEWIKELNRYYLERKWFWKDKRPVYQREA